MNPRGSNQSTEKSIKNYGIPKQHNHRIPSGIENLKQYNYKIKSLHNLYESISQNDKVAKVSIVGAGMVSTPGVTYKMFRGLAEEKVNILAISTSEIKLSVIISENDTLKAIKK